MQLEHLGNTFEGSLRYRQYGNGNLAVQLLDRSDGSLYATLSVNVEGVDLPDNQFVAKTYSENAGLNEQLISQGYFKATGRTVQVGYAGEQPILELTDK